jgi:peptidyl-prolyl cis-trans isomerase B (cyclophilin B)
MTVKLPEGAAGEAEVQLLAPQTAEVVEKAPVTPGAVNLAEKFTMLWTTAAPRLLYAQLVVGGKKVGPAVVLQPMVTPNYAPRVDQAGEPMFADNEKRQKLYSGIRAYVDKNVVLDTSKGEIEISLRPDVAPNTVWNFRDLVAGGFYTDILFHRVMQGFMDQVGDPLGSGGGGPGYYIDLEPSNLPHDFGVLSMARTGEPNSNGSQIFLCLSRNATAPLDGKYTSFGQIIRGGEVIKAIGAVPVKGDRPVDPPMLKSAKLVDAAPYGDGPKPQKDPDSGTPAR